MTGATTKGPLLGMRHVQVLLIFLNIVVVYIGRLNVSIAVVAMTDAEGTNPDFEEFDWNEKHKAVIISSFYWGYVITQFPGGYLCRRFGAKLVMFIGTFGTAVFSVVTPLGVRWGGWQIFCAIRIVQGLFQGLLFPCIHEHLAKWSPPAERNRLGAVAHTGIECGNVMAMFFSGMIAASSLGWPGISYISSAIAFGWCILWAIFASDNAPGNRFITRAERDYIETSMQRPEGFHEKKIPIPWHAIATSVPFYALLVARCAQGWGFSTIQTQIPSYLNGVLNMEMKSNAMFSSLPYLCMWAMSYVYVIIADMLASKKVLTMTGIRKSINTVAFWVPAVTLIGVGFLDSNQKSLAIALMTISVAVNGGATIGCILNSIDLSPNHTSILMGIANTIANIILIITPLVVGFIVTDESDRTQWQLVFAIAAVIFFVGNLVYIIWGTSETQPWDAEDYLLPQKELPAVEESKDVLAKSKDNQNGIVSKD